MPREPVPDRQSAVSGLPASSRPWFAAESNRDDLARAVLAAAGVANCCQLLILSPLGEVLHTNDRARDALAIARPGQRDFLERDDWEDPRALRQAFDAVVDGALRAQAETRRACCQGEAEWVRWSLVGHHELPGYPLVVVAIGIELTDLQQARAENAERAALLRSVLDTAVDAVVIIDETGLVERVNPATEALFQYTPEELLGRNVSMLMTAEHAERHDHYIARYRAGGAPRIIGVGREVEARRKDGSVFPAELAVSELVHAGRRRFTGMIRDISDRRRTEQQARLRLDELAHATRLLELGEMTSGIAHEVNQPLTAIVGFARACERLMKMPDPDPELLADALRQIGSQAERAGGIIHRLRAFARKEHARHAPTDVNVCIREVLSLIDHEIRRSQIRVQLELDPALPAAIADKVQVEQVILNLARNAVEAMAERPPGDRQLTIRSAATRRGPIEVTVADTGPGLPADDPGRVFERFYTTKPSGMGVGLAISRSIIDAHHGKLVAESASPCGATFRFQLPRADATGVDGE